MFFFPSALALVVTVSSVCGPHRWYMREAVLRLAPRRLSISIVCARHLLNAVLVDGLHQGQEALINVRKTCRGTASQASGRRHSRWTVSRQTGHASGLGQECGHPSDSPFKADWVLAFPVLTLNYSPPTCTGLLKALSSCSLSPPHRFIRSSVYACQVK